MSGRFVVPAVVLAAALLFFATHLDAVGVLSADEPRYASIGRAMAESGDWITPRLWGNPWFEKPPLLYWLVAAGHRAGLRAETAARLPVALLSAAFLVLFYWRLRREFDGAAAALSTLVLATSAGWLTYSRIAVTDLPLAATLGAAVMFALPWLLRGETAGLGLAGGALGVAVLAKGLVGPVLVAPLAAYGIWRRPRTWTALWRPAVAFTAIALPWYWMAWARHGREFFDELILKHHLGRFASDQLQHVQPWWFYVPVLAAGLLPWSPALAWLRGDDLRDARLRPFWLWLGWGFLFFSAAVNKLPGYLLPLMPAAAVLIGVRLARRPAVTPLVLAAVLGLAAWPVATAILPAALDRGLTRVTLPAVLPPGWIAFALVAAAVTVVWHRRDPGRSAIPVAAALGLAFAAAAPGLLNVLEQRISARKVWTEIAPRRVHICVEHLDRDWEYGLNYYAGGALPSCESEARPERLVMGEDGRPLVAPPTIEK